MREPDPNAVTRQICNSKLQTHKSDVSMNDRNSLFSKSSQLSKELLLSRILMINRNNYDSGQSKILQQKLSEGYNS